MSKHEQPHGGLEDLFKRLKENNPRASERELSKLFIDAIREDSELVAEAVDWFIERHYPAARKN